MDEEVISCDRHGVVIDPLPTWHHGGRADSRLQLRKVTRERVWFPPDRAELAADVRPGGHHVTFELIAMLEHGCRYRCHTWVFHPTCRSLMLWMRSNMRVDSAELITWMETVGIEIGDIAWYRARRDSYGTPLTASEGTLENALAAYSREFLERASLAAGDGNALREFDALVNGRSLYALDKAALEQLLVSIDWHLQRRR